MRGFEKPENAVLDYSFDWSDWLESGEAIASSQWYVPSPLAKAASTNTASVAVVWLSAGTYGDIYVVTNTITTDSNPARVDSRSFKITMTER